MAVLKRILCIVLSVSLVVSLLVFSAAATSLVNWDTGYGNKFESSPSHEDFNLSDGSTSTWVNFYEYLTVFTDVNWADQEVLSVSAYYSVPFGYAEVLIKIPGAGDYQYFGNVGKTTSSPSLIQLTRVGDYSGSSTTDIQIIDLYAITYPEAYGQQWIYELIIDVTPMDPDMPVGDGGIYSFTVDPATDTNFRDVRDYVRHLFQTFTDNSYFPACFYPYYTISLWRVSDSVNYIVLTISEDHLIYSLDYDDSDNPANDLDFTTLDAGSQMTYVGVFTDINDPVTFYYTSYYAPALSPTNLYRYDTQNNSWLGLEGSQPSVPVSGLPVERADVSGFPYYQHYYLITNYDVPCPISIDDERGMPISSTNAIPAGYMALYSKWFSAGGDADHSVLLQILEKVTHIDQDLHTLLGSEVYADDSTKEIDKLVEDGATAFEDSLTSVDTLVSDSASDFSEVNTHFSSLTEALGQEWTLLVGLMGFALIALLLQRRTG